jgi:hypothetical protein
MTVQRIGKPRGHDLLLPDALDARCHRPGLIVGKERKRAAFAGTVTGLAVLLENGSDILRERRWWRLSLERGYKKERA